MRKGIEDAVSNGSVNGGNYKASINHVNKIIKEQDDKESK